MRIRSVSTAVVEANFDWTMIRIETDDGLIGWGESFFAPGLTSTIRELGRLLCGQDATNIAVLTNRLRRAASGAGTTGGIIYNALSGIDAALWDLNARAAGLPLWQLLGGRFHERIRLYVDCHGTSGLTSLGPLLELRQRSWERNGEQETGAVKSLFEPGADEGALQGEAILQRASEMTALGFDALKFDIDIGRLVPSGPAGGHVSPAALRAIEDLLTPVRSIIANGVDVALDCHWRYDLATARRLVSAFSDVPLLWIEDPLAPDDISGLLELSRATIVPLASGENLNRWAAFAPLIENRAVSIVTPDLGKVGGVNEARMIADTAHARGLSVAVHNIAGPVGTMFAAHVAATFPNLIALEFHAVDVPFFGDLVDGPVVGRGAVELPSKPGIGIDVHVDEVKRWAKAGEPVFDGVI